MNIENNKFIGQIRNKKVLFVATKNEDYLRIQQEIDLLKKYSLELTTIVSPKKSYLLRLINIYRRLLLEKNDFDTVFIGFAPQLIVPLFYWKFKNNILVVDFFISLYDTFVFDRKKFKDKSLFAKFLHWLDKYTIKRADCIVCDTIEHGKYFIKEFSAKQDKIDVLYLHADSKYYYPRKIEKPILLRDKFTVIYFGSVLPLQGLDVVIDAINKIKDEQIYFFLIGPLSYKMKNNIKNINVKIIPWVSQKELADYIAYSDLCLAGHFASTIDKAKRVIPGKAYIFEVMNKKIILGDNSANRERYPEKYANVEFVKMGDSQELANKILETHKKKEFKNGN